MGSQTELTYYLPLTLVGLRCTVTTSKDTLLDKTSSATSGWTAELVTVADRQSTRSLVLVSGLWRDYALTLGLTPDGRLTQAEAESTGQVGKVLAGAATLAVAAAALAAGQPGLAASATAGALLRLQKGPSMAELQELLGELTEAEPETRDPVADAYARAHPAASERLAALTTELADTQQAVDEARQAYLTAAATPDRWAAQQRYQASQSVLADVAAELEKARDHFRAWRKTTFTEVVSVWDVQVPLNALPTFDGHQLAFPESDHANQLRELFAASGQMVALPASERLPANLHVSAREAMLRTATATLHVRRPRMVELITVAGNDPCQVAVTSVSRELVMDGACEEVNLPVRKSWFAKRRTDLQLSELGALIKVEFNGASSVAEATAVTADAVKAAPGQLESAAKGRTALQTLASAADEARLAQLKRQVEIAKLEAELAKLARASQPATPG